MHDGKSYVRARVLPLSFTLRTDPRVESQANQYRTGHAYNVLGKSVVFRTISLHLKLIKKPHANREIDHNNPQKINPSTAKPGRRRNGNRRRPGLLARCRSPMRNGQKRRAQSNDACANGRQRPRRAPQTLLPPPLRPQALRGLP